MRKGFAGINTGRWLCLNDLAKRIAEWIRYVTKILKNIEDLRISVEICRIV